MGDGYWIRVNTGEYQIKEKREFEKGKLRSGNQMESGK